MMCCLSNINHKIFCYVICHVIKCQILLFTYILQVFSAATGEFRFRFGRKGHLPGQLMRPTGIAVTSSGNYLVADYENCSLNVFRCAQLSIYFMTSEVQGTGAKSPKLMLLRF